MVHTHLQEEPLSQDDLMDLVFLRLDCIAAIRVDPHGGATQLEIAHIIPQNNQDRHGWEILPPIPCYDPYVDFQDLVQALEEELERNRLAIPAAKQDDRAILVSVTSADRDAAGHSMDELVELAHTSGIIAAETIIQRQRAINPKYLIGKGKLSEIVLRALQCGVDLLIFDQELNPSQVRSITDTTELRPGETTLEINRRRTKDRITNLENDLKLIRKGRRQRRSQRVRKRMPIISIVGYTNAGKSTLLNTLTKSLVFVEDKLFATLDPTSRRLRFPRDLEVIITDTVGFIRDLPKDLLDAFAATLEELDDADLLLHVIDISNPQYENQMQAVDRILSDLELRDKETILVFNKADLVDPDWVTIQGKRYGAVAISALSSKTLEPLILAMQDHVEALLQQGLFRALPQTTEESVETDAPL